MIHQVSSISKSLPDQLPAGEPSEETQFTSQNSECSICRGAEWVSIKTDDFVGVKRCECFKRRLLQRRLGEIPERFRACTFENYDPRSPKQMKARALMMDRPLGNYYICGPYGNGKTHLLIAQYRKLIEIGVPCHLRMTVELLGEIQREEIEDYISPMFEAVRRGKHYHLLWDDVDKFKPTEFKSQGLYELVERIYRRGLGLTVTTNLILAQLAECERLDPAIVRRLDDHCKVVEV